VVSALARLVRKSGAEQRTEVSFDPITGRCRGVAVLTQPTPGGVWAATNACTVEALLHGTMGCRRAAG
jgi:hypothetical protein